jgi:acyl-CoA synthetase (AMP-forming)/AMP-acid ligase II
MTGSQAFLTYRERDSQAPAPREGGSRRAIYDPRMAADHVDGSPEPLAVLLGSAAGSSAALRAPEDPAAISYGELAGRVGRLAGRLATLGVHRGDRVALVAPNGPEIVQLILAITALGAAAAPLNPAYTADEHTFYLGDITPRLLLLPLHEYAAARAVAGQIEIVDIGLDEGGLPSLARGGTAITDETAFTPGQPDDVALLLHTSGTTSRPKQVPLLQRNLMASTRTIVEHYRLGPEDVSFCVMPLFHIHGLVASTFAALASGGSVVVPRRFSPRRFWSQARETGTTWFSAGPTLHQMILEKADGGGPPAGLRFVRSCSSALSPALMARLEDAHGAPVLEAYGMTEASHQMASNPLPPAERLPGSVGIATGVELGIVDAGRALLPPGSYGEVVIRGPGVMPGYVGNPAANADAFFDGWFRTGDRGVIEDGYLRLEGRLKEMILRGGENISPAEIEDVLLRHPAVSDAACFGVDDEKYGEEVAAAVALSGDADEAALIAYCAERLAPFKVPRVIHVLDAIPRTATGKLQRRRVAEHVAEQGLSR